MREYDGRPLYKVIFMCSSVDQLAPAIEALEKEFYFLVQDVAAANCINGELINRKFDKGLGIRRMAEALDFPIEDTVGFGDSMNDLEMIETVGTSVCMANGSPQLKRKGLPRALFGKKRQKRHLIFYAAPFFSLAIAGQLM